jgi:Fur family iron response transcriptional regulator
MERTQNLTQYTMAEIEQLLQEKGIQPTLQRLSLCRFLLCEADHPTADDVYDWAQKNLTKISQATIYNTLGTFVEAGLLRTFKFPHSEKLVYDSRTADHFHFMDERTGKLLDLNPQDIKVKWDLPKKYKVNGLEIIVKGEIKS